MSILVLSEDSADQAYDTVRELTLSVLRLVDEKVRTHRIRFEPLENKQARRALRANTWKSKKPEDQQAIRDLHRAIANKLAERNGFVVFHFDGDRKWTERAKSENCSKFAGFITTIEQVLRDPTVHRGRFPRSESQISEAKERLLPLVPFYSIEAWLYQNTETAIVLCRDLPCGAHQAQLVAWQTDRSLLDELEKPKDALCLRGEFNHDLARTAFPSREVRNVGKSLATAVATFENSTELSGALARTWAEPE